MNRLNSKRIIIGITGGIAAYKSAELTRLFIKAGAEVRIVMTRAATQFITPLTMQALSGNRVHLDLLDPEAEAAMGHIELARWADLILIAPASADFIARIVTGQANDILSTVVLACNAPLAIAPAMNQAMWLDQSTQKNLVILTDRRHRIFGPAEGEQACGDVGPGRMLEPEQLCELSSDVFHQDYLSGLHIVISGGPTREAIDPVRFISNHSSGKMAYALAAQAVAAGAKVTLVSGPVTLSTPDRVTRVDVVSADEMFSACMQYCGSADIFIGVAAVSDYKPVTVSNQKIKKSADQITLELTKNPDIVASVAKLSPRPFTVGFAAETQDVKLNGISKLKKKNLDLLFANNATDTFNSDDTKATALWNEGEQELGPSSKNHVAGDMLKLIKKRLEVSKNKESVGLERL